MIRLRELRKEFNMSLNDVGNMLHTTRQAVSYWERGRSEPKLETWKKLTDYFDVDPEYLVGWSDVKRKNAQ